MDLDAGAVWDFAGEIVGTIRPKQPAQRATVTRIDSEGTVWVKTPDGAEAPAAECGADVRPGDEVTLGFDGTRMSVDANVSNPPAASSVVDRVREIAGTAKDIASAVGQHFWFDGNGAHVSTEANDPAGRQNTIWNSLGMLFRAGTVNLLAIVTGTDPGVDVYDGQGNAGSNIIAAFHGSGTQVGSSQGSHISIDPSSIVFWADTGARAVDISDPDGLGEAVVGLAGGAASLSAYSDGQRNSTLNLSMEIEDYDEVYELGGHADFEMGVDIGADSTTGDTISLARLCAHRLDEANDKEYWAGIELRSEGNTSSIGITIDDEEFTLGNPAEDARYGTAATSASVSVGSSAKSIVHVDLTPGVYIVTGHAVFASDSTGRRSLALGVTADTIGSNAGSTCVTVPAADGAATQLMAPLVYSVTSDTTLYLTVQQASGSTLGVQGQIRYVRIL